MTELNRFDIVGKYADEETVYDFRPDGECYDADEVDNVIADLEESHKKEVKQLFRHHKFKRCLDNAEICSRNVQLCICDTPDWPRGNVPFWRKWYRKWLELADKFKGEMND